MSGTDVSSRANSYITGLSETGLQALFDGSANVDASFDTLQKNAKSRDANSIELLLNLSLSQYDHVAARAQTVLTDIYTDRGCITSGVSDRLAKAAARFYEDNRDRTAAKPKDGSASRLDSSWQLRTLAAAGAKLDNASNLLQQILARIKNTLFGDAPVPPRTGQLPPTATEAIGLLGASAANGARASADLLLDLAPEDNTIGRQAEDTLFDIFSGRTESAPDVANGIAKKALQAYNGRGVGDSPLPLKLLYMAGAATEQGSVERTEIGDAFRKAHPQVAASFPSADGDPWSTGRFMDDRELEAALKAQLPSDGSVEVTYPIPVAVLENQIHDFSSLLHNKNTRAVFVPLNIDDKHWVSLAIYKDPSNDGFKAAFFDSSPMQGSNNTSNYAQEIGDLLHSRLNMKPHSFTVIAEHLQGAPDEPSNTPNACGLFTVTALEEIVRSRATPDRTLKGFSDRFRQLDAPAQQTFNVEGRRRALGCFVDALAHKPAEADRTKAASRATGSSAAEQEHDSELAEALRRSLLDVQGPFPVETRA